MRRIIAIMVLCMILTCSIIAHAEVTREQLDDLTDSERSMLKAEITIAYTTRKAGSYNQGYSRILNTELSQLSTEELEWIKLYLDGELTDDEREDSTIPQDDAEDYSDSIERLRSYLSGNMYGTITVDVSPVVDFLDLMKDNGIDLRIKEIGISPDKKEYEWIDLDFGDTLWMIYTRNYDDSGDMLNFCVSNDYRPQQKALVLMLESLLGLDDGEAESLYHKLQYNIVDGVYCLDGEGYRVEYSESKWFYDMIIRRYNDK